MSFFSNRNFLKEIQWWGSSWPGPDFIDSMKSGPGQLESQNCNSLRKFQLEKMTSGLGQLEPLIMIL